MVYRCPVCNQNLAEIGAVPAQEMHVKTCLEGGSGATPQAAKYLVYRLPAESVLIGVECSCSIVVSFILADPPPCV
jgi:hypothetical protein